MLLDVCKKFINRFLYNWIHLPNSSKGKGRTQHGTRLFPILTHLHEGTLNDQRINLLVDEKLVLTKGSLFFDHDVMDYVQVPNEEGRSCEFEEANISGSGKEAEKAIILMQCNWWWDSELREYYLYILW